MSIHVDAYLSRCFLGAIPFALSNRVSPCARACQIIVECSQQAQRINLSASLEPHPGVLYVGLGDETQVSPLVRQALFTGLVVSPVPFPEPPPLF